jgi:hypothetical protein
LNGGWEKLSPRRNLVWGAAHGLAARRPTFLAAYRLPVGATFRTAPRHTCGNGDFCLCWDSVAVFFLKFQLVVTMYLLH